MQGTLLDFFVERKDNGYVSVEIMHEYVAPLLVINDKSIPP